MHLSKEDKKFVAVCLLPAIVLSIFFFVIPLIRGLGLSFTNSSATTINGDFVGLENYIYMLQSEDFWQSFFNTVKLLIVVPVTVNIIAIVFAFFITQGKLKESSFYRFIFFFPNIIAATAISILWANIYSPTLGLLKKFLEIIGLEALAATPWLGTASTVLPAIAITMIWQMVGYYMVMYIAAIDGIDPAVFEAASIDGCGTFKKLIYITLPLLKDMIGVTFILTISGTIGMSYIYSSVMTKGGPSGSSSVLLYHMYEQAFELSNFGYAMSIAVFTLLFAFGLSLLSRKLNKAD